MKNAIQFILILFIFPFYTYSQCISGDCENGKGVYIYPDKTKAEGFWKNGKLEGQCSMFYSDGSSYVGEKSQDKKNGKGKFIGADGSSSEGIYKNDTLSGSVIITYPKGSVYVGTWTNDKKNGNGKYTSPNGYSAEGKFINDTLEGYATIKYSNGDKYIGDVKKGIQDGKGIYYFKNGDKFEGPFKNGKFNGEGIKYYAKGGTLKGIWVNDEYISGSNTTTNNPNSIIPFLNNGGVYEVNTNLNNVLKLDMIFDTGAGEVQFSRDIYLTLIKTKTISLNDILEGGFYEDANGNINYNVRFNLRQMKIGNITIENIPCCVAKDENGSNLLGLSALKKIGKFEFDFDKSVINFK